MKFQRLNHVDCDRADTVCAPSRCTTDTNHRYNKSFEVLNQHSAD